MGLKQIQDSNRIIFLKEFTKYILYSLYEEQRTKEKIEIEKLRQKFAKPASSEEVFRKIIKAQSSKFQQESEQLKPSEYQGLLEKRKQTIYRKNIPKSMTQVSYPKPFQKKTRKIIPYQTAQQINSEQKSTQFAQLPKIFEKSAQKPLEITSENPFKKIDILLKDPAILSIECSGPGKNIIVKRYNQINTTKITLNQSEINGIINEFSKQARIPVVGGILKAAVGNSIISAVVSEFVGSRFIINKITPYSLINKGV